MERKEENKLMPEDIGNDGKLRKWELQTEVSVKKKLLEGTLVLDMEVAKAAGAKKDLLVGVREERWDAHWAEQVTTALVDYVVVDDKDQHKLLERWQAKAAVLGASRPARPAQAAAGGEAAAAAPAGADEKSAPRADRLAKILTAELLEFLCTAVRAESADAVKKRSAQDWGGGVTQ